MVKKFPFHIKMPILKFYNIKEKKSYPTDNYKFEVKDTSRGKRYFAIAYDEKGNKLYRSYHSPSLYVLLGQGHQILSEGYRHQEKGHNETYSNNI